VTDEGTLIDLHTGASNKSVSGRQSPGRTWIWCIFGL